MSLIPKPPSIHKENWDSVIQFSRCVENSLYKLASFSLGPGATPTFASLTLTDLTASRLVSTNASKTLTSVTNLASWIAGTTNRITVTDDGDGTVTLSAPQDIHTGASPTFVGLTLSGLTAGSVLFAGTGGIISQDNSNFFWDDTNNRLGIQTTTPACQIQIGTLNLGTAAAAEVRLGITDQNFNGTFRVGESATHSGYLGWLNLTNQWSLQGGLIVGTYGGTDPVLLQPTGGNLVIGAYAAGSYLCDVRGTLGATTLTLSTMTPGSILFAGTGGLVSQDNTNLFWDNTNKRLGMGTTTPVCQIQLGALDLGTPAAAEIRLGVADTNFNGTIRCGESATHNGFIGWLNRTNQWALTGGLILGTFAGNDPLLLNPDGIGNVVVGSYNVGTYGFDVFTTVHTSGLITADSGLVTTSTIDASGGEVLVEDNGTTEPTNKDDGYVGVAKVGGQPRIYFTIEGVMYYVEGSASAATATGNPIGLLLTLTYNLE